MQEDMYEIQNNSLKLFRGILGLSYLRCKISPFIAPGRVDNRISQGSLWSGVVINICVGRQNVIIITCFIEHKMRLVSFKF